MQPPLSCFFWVCIFLIFETYICNIHVQPHLGLLNMPLAYSSIFMFSLIFFQFVWWCFSRILAFSSPGIFLSNSVVFFYFLLERKAGGFQLVGMMEQPGSEKILEADMILLALGFLGRAVLVVVGGLESGEIFENVISLGKSEDGRDLELFW